MRGRRWRVVSVIATLASMFACGGTDSAATSRTSGDGDGGAASCPGTYAIAALSDYSASALATLAANAPGTFESTVDLGKDPALARSNGHLYWIDRDLDQIFPLDSCGGSSGAIGLRPASAPNVPLDPQDLAVASDGALWIPDYDVASVQILTSAGAPRSTIDLSSYDRDKNPDASSVNIVTTSRGEEAFVALERLTQKPMSPDKLSQQTSLILEIATGATSVQKNITLAGRNPFGQPVLSGTFLYFAEPGNVIDSVCDQCGAAHEPFAGIERFDTEAESGVLIATETQLGGSVVEVAVSHDGACGAAILADASDLSLTSLVTFDPQAQIADAAASPSTEEQLLSPTPGFDLAALAWVESGSQEILLVGDRQGHGPYAVHRFARQAAPSCALTKLADLSVEQPPVAIRAVTN